MKPDISQWRSSPSYDYVDDLTAPDIGWEWLRRNAEYQRDYADLQRVTDTRIIDLVSRNWGLRFPRAALAQGARSFGLLAPRRRHRKRHPRVGAVAASGKGRSAAPRPARRF